MRKQVFLVALFAYSVRVEAVTVAELSRHNSSNDCWVSIDHRAYDITSILADHKTKYHAELSPWCGRDATSPWYKKDNGKPHSRKAQILLKALDRGAVSGGAQEGASKGSSSLPMRARI